MNQSATPGGRSLPLPDGFREVAAPQGWGWVRPAALPWFSEALAQFPTLYEAARDQVERSASDGPDLRGRAPVFVLPLGFASVAVRHYFRGGAVASLFGDRYLSVGFPRPIAETLASEKLRSLGIPTPQVIAAAVYPHGAFYRGDIATELIEGGVDLGEYLFGVRESGSGDAHGVAALVEAMALIERLSSAGMHHPDLNVKNFLVQPTPSSMKVHVLDLDRCKKAEGNPGALRNAMVRRFRSSLSKWERRSERRLSPEAWEAIRHIPMS